MNKRKLQLLFGGQEKYYQRIQKLSPIAYYPLNEPSGTVTIDRSGNGYNGTYSGATLAQPGIGDGQTSALFGETGTTLSTLTTSGIIPAINTAEISILLWYKVSAVGVWTDSTTRYLFEITTDGNNYASIYKSSTNNRINMAYSAGATSKFVTVEPVSSTGFIFLAYTASKSNNQFIGYLNGSAAGTTQTGLGTWSGNPTLVRFGSQSSGYYAHVAVFNKILTPAQILGLSVV